MDNHAYEPDDNRAIERNFRNGRPFTVERNTSRSDRNDYLVEVNSRAKLFKQPHFYKKSAILFLVLAIIFFIVMVVFIILYSKDSKKICTSNECLKTASSYLSSIDYRVDPCDNFYEFSCGRWSEEHVNHGWWSSFSSFTSIAEKIAIASLSALNEESDINKPEAVNKSKDFYKSCMDLGALDDLGITSSYKILEKMDLPIIPSYMKLSENHTIGFNWLRADALVKNVLLLDIFVGATVGPNIFNGSQNVLYIGQIYQTSPLPSPLNMKTKHFKKPRIKSDTTNDEKMYEELSRNIRSNLISYVITTVVLNTTGNAPEEDKLQKAADVIIEISDFIDEAVANTTDTDADESDVYPISIENLQKEVNSEIQKPQKDLILNYLKYLFNGTNVTITSNDLLYVTDMDVLFLKIIISYLTEIPDIKIELYMWWVTMYAMIINTSDEISEYVTKEMNVFSSDSQTIVRSRSLECALLVNNYMGYAISYILADKAFLNTTKPKVERMVTGLKEAFVNRVNHLSWMDSKTKKVTLEKSKEMITFIGYPDWLFEDNELDKHYNNIDIKPNTYLENMINVIVAHAMTNLQSLRKVHKRDWYSEPIEVNAFNSFSDNAINVPMAILNFPMYHLGLEVLNYGSIGSILGHELTHGFDNTGRKHDKYGNYVQWWTNKTIETFEILTECFITQYNNFTIEGVENHVNGKKTLGENLADNGGLNQAFSAYKNYIEKYGEEPKLPGFENYTSSQIFFIAYANIWCETTSLQDLASQLEYDEHCPNHIRVLGSLQNSEDFAREFHCPLGSPMNPKKKCKIW